MSSLIIFLFAATSMLKPQTPFYPGAYHLVSGHSFALALIMSHLSRK
jgi:hypothetical protein